METRNARRELIGVIGSGGPDREAADLAYQVGRGIAEAGFGLICGGLGGVMEAACRGAVEGGGLTVGILPGNDPAEANPFVAIPIATGMGVARNVIIVRSALVLIAVKGGPGTLSEVAFAVQLGVPVVSLKSYELFDEIISASDPAQAVAQAVALVGKRC